MAAPVKMNLKMYQGSTFREVLRWESSIKVYKPITNITKAAPAVVTATAHGIPEGWRARISGVLGMKEINSEDYNIITAATNDEVTFNSINASGYTAYTSGGILEYNSPVNLTGYTGRLQLRPKVNSDTVLLELTTENGGIALDTIKSTITLLATAAQTQDLTFSSAVYSLEMIKAGEVSQLITGSVTLIKEVTR